MNAIDAALAGVASGGNNAAPALPASTPAAVHKTVEDAAAAAFVHGFRWVMGISALLALGGAVCAWAMLGRTRKRD